VAAWFVVPVLLDFAISKLGRPLFLSSYLIVVLPAFLLLGAAGLVRLPGRAAGMIVLALLIVCSGVGLADWYRQPTWNDDFRGATRYIVGHWLPGDGIVYYPFYARFGFAYYHAPPGPTEPGSRFGSFAPPRLWLAMRLPGDGIVYYPSYERFGFAYHQAPAGTTEPAVARFGSRPPRLWVVMRVAPQRQGVIEQMFLGAYGPVVNTGAFRGLAVILYRATSTPSTSNILRPHGVIPSAGAACFKAAGAFVKGPEPAGRGTAVYVVTQDRAAMGFVKAPNTTIAARLQRIFARAGGHIKPLKNDPTAFGFYRGTLTSTDSGLLSKCTG
jgi:hypothetical protein